MEQRLKQRLVGAVVLIALAVVAVPMLLDAPLDRNEEPPNTAPLPERPQGEFEPSSSAARGEPETPRLDAEVERQRAGSATSVTATDTGTESEEPATVAADRVAAVTGSPATGPDPQPAPGSADPFPPSRTPGDVSVGAQPVEGSNGWSVQLGSFQRRDNARALRDRLLSSGYDAFVRAGASEQGEVFRVFVGSALDREQARRSAAKLQKELQLEGFVVRQTGS